MYLLSKQIENITEDDIKQLILDGVSESKILEYKKELKIDKHEDKKEFLYDITSFANTEGGTILYGIEEQKDVNGNNTGIPSRIIGISIDNKDKLFQKIEELAKNGIEPKLNSLGLQSITVDGLEVLLIRVQKSIGLPYMVAYSSTNKFYKRRNTGKYLLDVYELNKLFMNSMNVKEVANNFRENRIKEVRELKFLPKLDTVGSYFLHVVPLGRFGENIADISDESKLNYLKTKLSPYNSSGYDFRHNLDGFMTFANDSRSQIPYSYVQLFRDGSLEFYTSHFHVSRKNEPDKFDLAGKRFEIISIKLIKTAFDVLRFYQIEPPYAVFISLFDLEHAVILTENMFGLTTEIIGKPKLLFPAVVFNNATQDISKTMKSTFDILWQAGNYAKSPFYDDNHERTA